MLGKIRNAAFAARADSEQVGVNAHMFAAQRETVAIDVTEEVVNDGRDAVGRVDVLSGQSLFSRLFFGLDW